MKLGSRHATPFVIAAACVFTLLWGGFLALRHLEGQASPLDRLEAVLLDLRFALAGPQAAPQGVVIAAIDDEAARVAGALPLPRSVVARLVDTLARAGAKAIAVDLLFVDLGTEAQNRALAQALTAAPTVTAAALLLEHPRPASVNEPGAPDAGETLMLPIAPIRAAAPVGLVNVSLDGAGTARHVPLLTLTPDGLFASLALRAATLAARQDPVFGADSVTLAGARTPLDLDRNLALRYYGPRQTITTVSAAAFLGDAPPAELVRDRVVMIGATARGAGDFFATPFDTGLPGVEVLATAVANLQAGDALNRTRAVRFVDASVIVFLPLVIVLLFGLNRIAIGLAAALALIAIWLVAAQAAFAWGIWLNMALPLAVLAPAIAATAFARILTDRVIKNRLAQSANTLGRFQSPALTRRLAEDPDFLFEPVAREAAVVFVDLTGFTRASEQLGPKLTWTLLRDFHHLVEDEVTHYGGLVVTYMGDGAMIVFGLLEPKPDDAERALAATFSLFRRTRRFLADLAGGRDAILAQAAGGVVSIDVKLGAHAGPLIVSRLGHATHQHITATGDTVNVASRLMEVAAEHGARIAISEDLLRAAGSGADEPEAASLSAAQSVEIRGRAEPLAVRFSTGDTEANPAGTGESVSLGAER